MDVLYWLLVPLLVTIVAAGWLAFSHRTRPPADPRDSMAEHARFKQAMERTARSAAEPSRDDPELPT